MLYWKNHLNIGGCDPILQHRTVLKILGTGSVSQGGEGNPGAGSVLGDVGVQTQRLLLIGSVDGDTVVTLPDLATVSGVILERLPCVAMVHGLVDSKRMWLLVAELKTDVGQLVLLAEGQGEGDVAILLRGQEFTVPACHIVGVVEVSQEASRMVLTRGGRVTHLTHLLLLSLEEGSSGWLVTMSGWWTAASGAGLHSDAIGCVDKVRDTLLGLVSLVIMTRV